MLHVPNDESLETNEIDKLFHQIRQSEILFSIPLLANFRFCFRKTFLNRQFLIKLFFKKFIGGDLSAGSPTDTLLRLLALLAN